MRVETCRFCGAPLECVFADLGAMPPANSYVGELSSETIFPLRVRVCGECLLVQAEESETPENIFSEYAYFSGTSKAWQSHCKNYCESMAAQYGLDKSHFVVEVASNDGCLLENFAGMGMRVLGVEPARNIALAANEKGVPTLNAFFGEETAAEIARRHGKAGLVVGNNVFAHVPDINGFARGLKTLLDAGGQITLEFPSLSELIRATAFDTIYHEHFYYFSLLASKRVLESAGLAVFHVEEFPTHGGSYRLHCCHAGDRAEMPSVALALQKELAIGLGSLDAYRKFAPAMQSVKFEALAWLVEKKRQGKRIAAFGAPAKGATFLNYCGIGPEIIEYAVDETPYKQNKLMPGARIPIFPPDRLERDNPDYVVILPWNWAGEILRKLDFVKARGGQCVTFIPKICEHFG